MVTVALYFDCITQALNDRNTLIVQPIPPRGKLGYDCITTVKHA